MTTEQFLNYFESYTRSLLQTITHAQKEYANPDNCFDNFDRLAVDLNMDRKKVLYVYMKKHLDAIRKYLIDPSNNIREPISGRIGDVIVYLILLNAMIDSETINNGTINTVTKWVQVNLPPLNHESYNVNP